jgi:hypothetical protein
MNYAAHNNSRSSQLAVTLSRVAAFCLLQKYSGTLTASSFRDEKANYENGQK